MATAELSLRVLFIAGARTRFLDFHFMMRKLLWCLRRLRLCRQGPGPRIKVRHSPLAPILAERSQPSLAQIGSCRSHSSRQSARSASEQKIQKALHLMIKLRSVPVPPYFAHAGEQIRIHILCPDHLLHSQSSMSAPNAAGLHAPVRRLADAETGEHIVHHHCPCVDPLG